nr:NACHT domain-containing protein [Amycolatopsis umgeniensis]
MSWVVPPLLAVVVGLETNAASEKLPSWVHVSAWPVLGVLTVLSIAVEFARRRKRDGRSDEARLSDAANALAAAVASQWSRELSGLLAGRALPQPWSTTGRPVLPPAEDVLGPAPVEAWGGLRRLFRRVRAGGSGAPVIDVLRRAAIRGDLDFHGDVDDLAALLPRLPHRQVILLGEPGAGKSVLAGRIALALCGKRAEDDPVPVLLPLSSWRVGEESVRDWIKRRLRADYASPDVERLVDADRLFALLDGVDELPPGLRIEAIRLLGASGLAMLVTTRGREYTDAVRTSRSVPAKALVVELRPIGGADVEKYLSAGLVDGDPRWVPVFKRLRDQPDGALRQVLRTPLMIDLARDRDPDDLLGFTDAERLEEFLLDGVVPAAYPGDRKDKAGRRLEFLAGHLRSQGTFEFAWWKLHRALPSPSRTVGIGIGLMAAALTSVAVWLMVLPTVAGAGEAVALSLAVGCVAGLIVGSLASASEDHEPRRITTRMRGRRLDLAARLGAGAMRGTALGVVIGVVAGVVDTADLTGPALLMGAASGAVFGVAYGLVGWLETPADLVRAASPAASLREDRTTKLVRLAVFGLPFGLSAGLVLGLVAGPRVGLLDGIGAGLLGVVVGLARGPHVWTRFVVARVVLALRGELPWRLMAFLGEAHRLCVLRANGGVYRFRHNLLQDRLAGGLPRKKAAEPVPARSPARSRTRRAVTLTLIVLFSGTGLGIGLPVAGGLQAKCGLTPFDRDIRYLRGGFTYECVGVTDGAYDFSGDGTGISKLIESQNTAAVTGSGSYVRVAVLAPLAPRTFDSRQIRHALRGVYLAQRRYNASHSLKVKVLLANEGSTQAHWAPVVDQLVRMSREEHPLVAVVGLGASTRNSVASTRTLAAHGIPMVAATASELRADGLFQVTPPSSEFAAALRRSWTGPAPEYVLTDEPSDGYVESLRKEFVSAWGVPEIRNGERRDLPGCPAAMLYAGRREGLIRLDDHFAAKCGLGSVTIGSVVTDLSWRTPDRTRSRLIYATPADPSGWSKAPESAPPGFGDFSKEYSGQFGEPPGDVFALLHHDAAEAAFAAIGAALGEKTPKTIAEVLRTVGVNGATGTFSFNRNGTPARKPIPVLTEPGRAPDRHPYLTR